MIRHLAYYQFGESPLYQAHCNLSQPAHSLFLLAPLAKNAGGLELCRQPVFSSADDPDYQAILNAIEAASKLLKVKKRFGMPGFVPNPSYVHQMQLFGILPTPLPADATFDVYETDQAYWRSCQPPATPQ